MHVLSGDILVFMPGQEDIEVTCELLAGRQIESEREHFQEKYFSSVLLAVSLKGKNLLLLLLSKERICFYRSKFFPLREALFRKVISPREANRKSETLLQKNMEVYTLNERLHIRNRFLFTVICCPIYHWLEVSREVDISRVQSASNIFTDN